jgi:hypothetical protein
LIFAMIPCSPHCGLAKQAIMDAAMKFRKGRRSMKLTEQPNRNFASLKPAQSRLPE